VCLQFERFISVRFSAQQQSSRSPLGTVAQLVARRGLYRSTRDYLGHLLSVHQIHL
jgi:hypothetical protein